MFTDELITEPRGRARRGAKLLKMLGFAVAFAKHELSTRKQTGPARQQPPGPLHAGVGRDAFSRL